MRRLSFITLCCLSLWSIAEGATGPFVRGFDLVPQKLTPLLNSGLWLDGAENVTPRSFSVGLLIDLNVGIMSVKLGQNKVAELLPFRADAHLMGAWQPFRRFDFGVDLPITVYQSNNFGFFDQQGFPQKAPAAFGLGDLRLFARGVLLRQDHFPIGAGIILEARAPTGDGDSFLGDRGFVFAPRLALERSLGPLRILANGGWRLRTADARYLNLYVGQEFTLGGGVTLGLPDMEQWSRNEILFEVQASTPAESPFTFAYSETMKTPMEAMLGLRSRLFEVWALQVGVGRGLGLVNGYGRETFRAHIGVKYEYDAPSDRDGDGIPDKVDQCPDVPEDFNGYQDEDGCPEGGEPDLDGDKVPDRVDACKETPGPKEYDGCPDRDGDQIPDNLDKCPDEPGPADNEGCPVKEEVILESDKIRVKGTILFEIDRAIIKSESFPMLDAVVKVLVQHPDVGPVLVEGHTDNTGSRAHNLDLSKRRAHAVVEYMVKKGIDAKRLRSEGFGFDRPVDSNDTALGRAKNRRTEFRLINDQEIPIDKGGPKKVPAKPAGAGATKAAATGSDAKKPVAPLR